MPSRAGNHCTPQASGEAYSPDGSDKVSLRTYFLSIKQSARHRRLWSSGFRSAKRLPLAVVLCPLFLLLKIPRCLQPAKSNISFRCCHGKRLNPPNIIKKDACLGVNGNI